MDLLMLSVTIVKLVDDAFPGWVECTLVDAAGVRHVFVDKVPVVTDERVDDSTSLPRWGSIACTRVSSRTNADGHELVSVDTNEPHAVASTTGTVRFEVFAEQLTPS